MNKSQKILSDIIVHQKYARYLPELKRREVWDEIVDRNMNMNIEKYPHLADTISRVYDEFVRTKKVLPSLRAMQFGGAPVLRSPNRQFNCSYLHMNRVDAFKEIMFLLLGGSGVGFGVQEQHVTQLPRVRHGVLDPVRFITIADSIEGWADSIGALCDYYFGITNDRPIFEYHLIRPKGARLITSGGKAPGPAPLKECLNRMEELFQANLGKQLRPIDVHDLVCFIADAVLAGGIRRAALISLFTHTDTEMITAKSGNWWETHPWRARANNSAYVKRDDVDFDWFMDFWGLVESSGAGEPGIIWTADYEDGGFNPCFSEDTLVQTREGHYRIKDLVGKVVDVWNGETWQTINNFRVTATNQPLLKITMQDGSIIRVTPYHEMILDDGSRVKAGDLEVDDRLMITNAPNTHGNVTVRAAYLKGFLVGDGSSLISAGRPHLWLYSPKYVCEDRLIESANELTGGAYNTNVIRELGFRDQPAQRRKAMTGLAPFKDELFPWCNEHKFRVPDELFAATLESKLEFIAGVMDADGTASDTRNGFLYQISSIHKEWLLDFQALLKTIGVRSKLSRMNKAGKRDFNDGYGEYECQETWRLTIPQAASIILSNQVKFSRLTSFADKRLTYQVKPRFNQVTSIEYDSVAEKVYCCTVEGNHQISITNGFDVGQCVEASLRDRGLCNLTEINAHDITSQSDLNARAAAASFIGTLQAGYTDFHYLSDQWKVNADEEALLGVSATGIASGNFTRFDLVQAAQVVLQVNADTADSIGVSKAARTTCVKPSGTASIVLGTSSGVHAWHSEYYVRRVRLMKSEALYGYLVENHPELVEDEYFDPANVAVISVPQAAPEGAVTRKEIVYDLLTRVRDINTRWVRPGHRRGVNPHNVSATISIRPGNWEGVGEWLWGWRNAYAGLSALPADSGTYKQTPFEDITAIEYLDMMRSLSEVDLSKVIEEEDETNLVGEAACSSGACEVDFA